MNLTQQEFSTWRSGNDQRLNTMDGKLDRVLDFIERRAPMDLESEKRMTRLETQQVETDKRASRVSAFVSLMVAVAGVLFGWLKGT